MNVNDVVDKYLMEGEKSTRWYIKFPSDAYAMGPITFKKPVGKLEVIKYAKEREGVNKLPRGFECYPE